VWLKPANLYNKYSSRLPWPSRMKKNFSLQQITCPLKWGLMALRNGQRGQLRNPSQMFMLFLLMHYPPERIKSSLQTSKHPLFAETSIYIKGKDQPPPHPTTRPSKQAQLRIECCYEFRSHGFDSLQAYGALILPCYVWMVLVLRCWRTLSRVALHTAV
jgi:hypothetical protein